ncbi:hypothetical protein EIY72_07340 [Pseudomonas vancouverensis]|uniref:Uncharacterized protein n=1 Tax=Pseudomonas vancouverensis TaxID=95300 RepID=A0A4R4KGF4_PSEVA|nr:hypothetical protein F7R09_10570 [Pseudomonas vancouverensis]TDB66753.1 hypothetical protein EIY72_07340 [Pseudomonas vancouverensis]
MYKHGVLLSREPWNISWSPNEVRVSMQLIRKDTAWDAENGIKTHKLVDDLIYVEAASLDNGETFHISAIRRDVDNYVDRNVQTKLIALAKTYISVMNV